MRKWGKIAVITVAAVAILGTTYVVAPGFLKRGDIYITDYAVSEDGTDMKITVEVAGSMEYVRKMTEHQQQGGRLYLDCYAAFGGLNGAIGAKQEYHISVAEDTEWIALYRSENCYEPVLERDENGEWQFISEDAQGDGAEMQ